MHSHACGGDWGTPLGNPCVSLSGEDHHLINVTTPVELTGSGGMRTLNLRYCCTTDFCSGESNKIAQYTWNKYTIFFILLHSS